MKRLNQTQLLMILAIILAILAALTAVLIRLLRDNPEWAWQVIPSQPTPTLIVLNGAGASQQQATLPPTWTPSHTPPPLPTLTPSNTPTETSTPTNTTTPVPTPTYTPVATRPAGWYEVQVEEAHFALYLPTTWATISLANRDAEALLDSFAQQNALLAESMRHGLGLASLNNLILVAFDTATEEDRYIVNLGVSSPNPDEGETIDAIHTYHLQRYERDSRYQLIGSDSTTVDFQNAHRIRYATSFEGPAGSTTVYHLEVITETRRGSILIFVSSISEERRNTYEALMDRIVTTIRFIR